MERVEVILPVCPECRRVGKIVPANHTAVVKNFCRGPRDAEHPKTRMVDCKFRQVESVS